MRFLTNLKNLRLDFNQINLLPEWIGELENLELLKLGNSFSFSLRPKNNLRKIPSSIGRLKNLKTLALDDVALSSIPVEIGNLYLLEHLSLSKNQLKQLPESIFHLSQLKTLQIPENKISGLSESIGRLRNLEKLDISKNKLKTLPKSIGNLKKLKELRLYQNPFESVPKSIEKLDLIIIFPLLKIVIEKGDELATKILKQKGFSVLEKGDIVLIEKIWRMKFFSKANLPKIEKSLFSKSSNFIRNAVNIIREDKEEIRVLYNILAGLKELGSSQVKLFLKHELFSYIDEKELYLSENKGRFLNLLSDDDLQLFFDKLSLEFFEKLSESIMDEAEERSYQYRR